jgi:mannose-6-phosphate isomerase-like protein (cupin superfamily)
MLVRGQSLKVIEFDGLKVFDYTAGTELGSSVALIEVPSGARHREAWSRRCDKYYLVVHGEVNFVLAGREFLMAAGDFCYVKQGDRFSYRNDSQQPATLVLTHTPSFDLSAEVFAD